MAPMNAFFGQDITIAIPTPLFKDESGYTDVPIRSEDMPVSVDYSHIATDADQAADRVIQSIEAEIVKLQKIKATEMTDSDTKQAARSIATIDAVMDWLRRDYPQGVPTAKAKIIEQLLTDLNLLTEELKERRDYYYIRSKVEPASFSQQDEGVPGTPGGGSAAPLPNGQGKKFPVGPVVAIGAGVLATWLALR